MDGYEVTWQTKNNMTRMFAKLEDEMVTVFRSTKKTKEVMIKCKKGEIATRA